MPTASDGPRVVAIEPDLSLPVDRAVTFRIVLDRRIAPGSIPQGVVEITSGDVYVFADLEIDVVRPALRVTPYDTLDPDVDYRLVVHGLRDLDGHVGTDSASIVFHTSDVSTPPSPVPVTYADVAPTLVGCAVAGCHGGPSPALGLDLSGAEGVRRTALGVGARSVQPSVSGFLDADVAAALIGLPRIDRGAPARSYLLYTMLGDEHIAGAPMPPDGALASEAELVRLEAWIRQGTPGL